MTRGDHVPAETIADHVEGLLSELEARRVARHLEGCADCRGTVALLESVSRILAAADPGAMPAWYVTRINADLARLAVTEPVRAGLLVAPPGLVAIGTVSRRRALVSGARRLSTAAAALVLLAGGTALGIGTIGGQGRGVGSLQAQVFDIPDDAVVNAHGDYVAPATGTIYVPDGAPEKSHGRTRRTAAKVLRPDGVAILRDAQGLPTYVLPKYAGKPASSPRPKHQTRPPGATHPATILPGGGNPYVTQSDAEYDEDNFSANVRNLLSGTDPRSNSDDVEQQAARDPADPAAAPAAAPARVAAASTSAELKARVGRCAARVGRRAIAGDEGFWGHRRATVVVVDSDHPNQVTGYVFYGRCDGTGPVTTRESPWAQQVDEPDSAAASPTAPPTPEPTASPPTAPRPAVSARRYDGVPESRTQIRAPASDPPVDSDPALPDAQAQN